MHFKPTPLTGAFIVDLERNVDERGFFARAFCANEFESHGLPSRMVQANLSLSRREGTVRGLHFQVAPATEPKFVRCIQGAVWDVIVDMRSDSPTYLQHFGIELSARNGRALYVPDMFAHGNQALTDNAELFYLVGGFYTPGCERGLRFDDPALGIDWPRPITVVSDKDRSWPLLTTLAAEGAP